MTRFQLGQSVRFHPAAARIPGYQADQDTGVITQVLAERGNATNANAEQEEDDPRYEIRNSRGKDTVVMEMDIIGEDGDSRAQARAQPQGAGVGVKGQGKTAADGSEHPHELRG